MNVKETALKEILDNTTCYFVESKGDEWIYEMEVKTAVSKTTLRFPVKKEEMEYTTFNTKIPIAGNEMYDHIRRAADNDQLEFVDHELYEKNVLRGEE